VALPPGPFSSRDLARAARLLRVRSLHEATGLFAGNYASAFRGGGLEFEESRPYAPGDDVRHLDWSASARTGELYVKRFRAERNQTLLFALDASASMAFGTTGRSKAETAAHAIALLAAAAGRAGDRCGLVVFDAAVRARVPVGRGVGHTWRVLRAAVETSADCRGDTDLRAALRAVRLRGRRRAVLVLLSDFRDPSLLAADGGPSPLRAALAGLVRRCDVVAGVIHDPRDESLPRAGSVRIADPERPGRSLLLRTGSARVRAAYESAATRRREELERELRRGGAEPLWLRTDTSPLYSLGRFFHERAGRRARAAS